jgi:hypothetical protein
MKPKRQRTASKFASANGSACITNLGSRGCAGPGVARSRRLTRACARKGQAQSHGPAEPTLPRKARARRCRQPRPFIPWSDRKESVMAHPANSHATTYMRGNGSEDRSVARKGTTMHSSPNAPAVPALISDLPGKVVLITGASTGIGAAAAVAFGRNRAKIAINSTPALGRRRRSQAALSKTGARRSSFKLTSRGVRLLSMLLARW